MRIFVIGASGGVGARVLARAVANGHTVTAQSRDGDRLSGNQAFVVVGHPADEDFLHARLEGHDAVVSCIGVDHRRATTLFSDHARALIGAMKANRMSRLVVVTGIGCGRTKGHGGWFYNRIIYPLFTRNRYSDKNLQETLIGNSGLDWTIVRPAPFSQHDPASPLHVLTGDIPENLQLIGISRDEVAAFIVQCLEDRTYVREKPFIGHAS